MSDGLSANGSSLHAATSADLAAVPVPSYAPVPSQAPVSQRVAPVNMLRQNSQANGENGTVQANSPAKVAAEQPASELSPPSLTQQAFSLLTSGNTERSDSDSTAQNGNSTAKPESKDGKASDSPTDSPRPSEKSRFSFPRETSVSNLFDFSDGLGVIPKIILSTLIVIGGIIYGLFYLKKSGLTKDFKDKAKTGIQVLDRLAVNSKSSVLLLQANDQKLIVGYDQNGLNSIVALAPTFSDTLEEESAEPNSKSLPDEIESDATEKSNDSDPSSLFDQLTQSARPTDLLANTVAHGRFEDEADAADFISQLVQKKKVS